MKYGVVIGSEWNDPEANTGFPAASICIAFLTDSGALAPNEQLEDLTRVKAGMGRVYSLGDDEYGVGEFLGYIDLPFDIAYVGAFDTIQEAIDAATSQYSEISLEQSINTDLRLNEFIDENIAYQ